MSKRYPWLNLRKKSEPELPLESPIWLGHWSNGEVFVEQTPRMRRMRQRILDEAEVNAKRAGVDRREFLVSAMGMATAISIVGCSDKNGNAASSSGGTDGGPPGCTVIPADAKFDETVACNVLSGNEFIFDIQTHHYVPDSTPRGWENTNGAYKAFFDATGWYSLTRDYYVQQLYLNSDTTMAVLSGLPYYACNFADPNGLHAACGGPISNEQIAESRDLVNMMANSLRLLNHAMVMPNAPKTDMSFVLDLMEHYACTQGVAGWKLYPAYAVGTAYFLDDEKLGIPMIQKGIDLGVPVFCIHKGLPIGNFFDTNFNQPRDIGVVAKRFPTGKFVVYHSAICAGLAGNGFTYNCPETPYSETDPMPTGTNQLIRSLQENGLGPGSNVYAELGTAFSVAQMAGTDNLGHFMGKLLKYVGEDNVVWGTDSFNGQMPQPLIEFFRTFQIPQALSDQYGYPQITPEIRAKVFGLNAAKVFGIDVAARRCLLPGETAMNLKRNMDGELGGRRWAYDPRPIGPKTRREFLQFRAEHDKRGLPG
jgi:predicted TIM-barrel fold metal-dependent hydrolase